MLRFEFGDSHSRIVLSGPGGTRPRETRPHPCRASRSLTHAHRTRTKHSGCRISAPFGTWSRLDLPKLSPVQEEAPSYHWGHFSPTVCNVRGDGDALHSLIIHRQIVLDTQGRFRATISGPDNPLIAGKQSHSLTISDDGRCAQGASGGSLWRGPAPRLFPEVGTKTKTPQIPNGVMGRSSNSPPPKSAQHQPTME